VRRRVPGPGSRGARIAQSCVVDKRRQDPAPAEHDQLEYDLSDFTRNAGKPSRFCWWTSEILVEWEPDGLMVVPASGRLERRRDLESMGIQMRSAGEVGEYTAEMVKPGRPQLESPARRLAGS